MGQIVRRKKKGRPSKADQARHTIEFSAIADPDLRRSFHRRIVRYNVIDYDEYILDDDDEVERRGEKKKLKLVMKLNQGGNEDEKEESSRSRTCAESRVDHTLEEEANGDEIEGEENEDVGDEDVSGVCVKMKMDLLH